MMLAVLTLTLAFLAIVTQVGTVWLERKYPPQGRFIHVSGAKLHISEIDPNRSSGLPIVLIAGASSSLETMRYPLGEHLARNHRVVLIDRPGQGWSTRERRTDSTPAIHARMIHDALDQLNIDRAIFVGHSWGGAVIPALAVAYPKRVAGLVMISAVAYPWKGDVDWIYRASATPVIGPLLAHTVVLPYGLLALDTALRSVFYPQRPPDNYSDQTQIRLVLRPDTFLNNAWDLASLRSALASQSQDYPRITAPITLIAGDSDTVVSTDIHSRQFARSLTQAKLVVLPNTGHMPQMTASDVVEREIEDMLRGSI
ncbi:MAG: alpha/beta hydrolase [Xanthobacteraceae bacterium]|nr:alpha/beta hydrolase [Xanthobacteraceae bacterium]